MNRITVKRIFNSSLLLSAIIALCVSSFPFQSVSAATTAYSGLDTAGRAQSYEYFEATKICINTLNMNDGIVASKTTNGQSTDPANGNWFQASASATVVDSTGKSASIPCNTIIKTGLTNYWGYGTTYYTLLQNDLHYKWHGVEGQWINTNPDSQKEADFVTAMKAHGVATAITASDKYWLNYTAFLNNCSPTPMQTSSGNPVPYSQLSSSNQDTINASTGTSGRNTSSSTKLSVVGSDGVITEYGYNYTTPTSTITGGKGGSATVPSSILVYGYKDSNQYVKAEGLSQTCDDMIAAINSNAQAYANSLFTDVCSTIGYDSSNTSLQSACIAGAKNKTNTAYCTATYYNGYYGGTFENHDAQATACTKGQGLVPSGQNLGQAGAGGGGGTPATSCVISGIGWLICPVMNALGGLNDALYAWVQSVLVLNPLTQTDSNGATTPQYTNWSIMRNLANVLLVIAFLFIIFSQISSIGISNYGVKKMLPRVILVAIAINLSWILLSLSVDIVNILGTGLHSLLITVAATNTGAASLDTPGATSTLIGGLVAGTSGVLIIGGIAAVGSAGLSTLALIAVPFILGAALALLAAVATLFLRNAIVIVLVIVAPVALAAYLLPNTEEYFKKWRKLFLSMLMLFPIAALLFAGAKFAAYIIANSNQPFAPIMALFVMAAPLGMLPWLARSSGGILATVNKQLGSMAKGVQNATQKGLAPRVDAGRAERKARTRDILGRTRKAYKPGTGEKYATDDYHQDKNGVWVPHKAGDLKKDKNGNEIGADPRRRNVAAYFSDMNQGLKTRTETAGKAATSNFQERGLRGDGSRSTAKVAAIMDAGETEGLRGKAIGAQYEARLQGRQTVHGSVEQRLTDNLEDAEGASERYKGKLKEENIQRIKSGATSTVAGAIGDPTLLNLRDVNRDTFVTTAETKAVETELERDNKETGGTNYELAVEHQKAAEAGSKLVDTQQDARFKEKQANNPGLRDVVEKQDAADRTIATYDEEKKQHLEEVAEHDVTLEDLQKRKEEAVEANATMHAEEEAKLSARQSPTGGIDPVTGLPNGKPGDLYEKYTREQEKSKLEKEKQEASQKAAYGKRQSDSEDLQGLADQKTMFEEGSTAGSAAAKARIDAAKIGRKDEKGNLVPVTGMDTTIQQGLADAGRGQAIASRNSSLASGVADVLRGKEINNDPGGELSRQMAGIDLGISDNTRLEDANAAKVTQADLRGDKESYDELHKRAGLSSKGLYEEVLGMKDSQQIVASQVRLDTKENPFPLAEELSAIDDIQQHGGADDQDNLFDYSSELTSRAIQAEKDYANDSTPENKLAAEKARTRSKTVHTALQRGWSSSSSLRPMQYGGSLEQTFANDTETRNKRQIQADRLGGGKYDHTIGTRNIDQLKALEVQLSGYTKDENKRPIANNKSAELLNNEFMAAFRPGAEWTVDNSGYKIKPSAEGYKDRQTRLDEVLASKVTGAKTNLSAFLLQLDKALDDPKSPPLSPEKNAKLVDIRADLIATLKASNIPLPGENKDPAIGPITEYRRLDAAEYNPYSSGGQSSSPPESPTTPPPATP